MSTLSESESRHLCRTLMTTDPQMEELITAHFTKEDYESVRTHMVGDGKIGGKACGFLLGRKLITHYLPEAGTFLEPHDSYYIGSNVFYTYLDENSCRPLDIWFALQEEQLTELDSFRQALNKGSFSPAVRKQFCQLLLHYDNTPLIIRSSSILEDGYANAFSGKYESVFCPNQGNLKTRLREFEQAVRKVYASTLSPAVLKYRKKRGLLALEEPMALLVQSVSGTRHGDLFFPAVSGVSFSYNPYRWMEHINPEAGMIRLVAGLGTRAVNRTPGDYPRLTGLDRPQAMIWPTTAGRHKYSQRYVDVLNLHTGMVETRLCEYIFPLLSRAEQKAIFSHDTDAEDYLSEQGRFRPVYFADCQGVVENAPYIRFMKAMLSMLEKHYQRPVDIEFSLRIREDRTIGIDLLQCRPLRQREFHSISARKHKPSEVLFELTQASMRSSKVETFDIIVVVDPRQYYETPHQEKSRVATAIGEINRQLEHKNAMLLVPGRIGTSSPELGVPVNYAEISEFKAVCEVSYREAGYQPELSYGSHMFQDMVEADVFYAAINENSKTRKYQPEILHTCRDVYDLLLPDRPEYRHIIQIYDLTDKAASLYLDAVQGYALCIITSPIQDMESH